MNSREFGHERFEELCALSEIGQISAEEFRELQIHLQTCTTCRLRQAVFAEILHDHLPLLAPEKAAMPGSRDVAVHDTSYKQRFLQRAQQATKGRDLANLRGHDLQRVADDAGNQREVTTAGQGRN